MELEGISRNKGWNDKPTMPSAHDFCNDWVSGHQLFPKPRLAPALKDLKDEAGRKS